MKALGFGLYLSAVFVFGPVWWWVAPTVWSCAIFWLALKGGELLWWIPGASSGHDLVGRILVAAGGSFNATVTIANGGFMPVIGMRGDPRGIWQPATAQDHLLLLADRFWGFSLGDLLIVFAILYWLTTTFLQLFAMRWNTQ